MTQGVEMLTVDWSLPVEAVRDDGLVARVTDRGLDTDDSGDHVVTIHHPDAKYTVFHVDGSPYVESCQWRIRNVVSHTHPAATGSVREAIEAECASLLAAYLRMEIGRIMHQAEHWAENGKPLAVHHRLMKADDYFQILVLMERDPAKGWDLPFEEIRKALARPNIHEPGAYPPNAELYRFRDPAFVVAALAAAPTPDAAASEAGEVATGAENEQVAAINAVFAENINEQASRLGVHPVETASPGWWQQRVRKAAVIAALTTQGGAEG